MSNRSSELFFPVVSAKAEAKAESSSEFDSSVDEDSSDEESNGDGQQVKKKPKKEKVGFRDRKVNPNYTIRIATCSIICAQDSHHWKLAICEPKKKKMKTNNPKYHSRSSNTRIECGHFRRLIKFSDTLPLFALYRATPPKCI